VGALSALASGFFKAAHINGTYVPTAGGSTTVPDVLGGHADLGSITPSVLAPELAAGTVKVLAVASASGSYPNLPGVPTFKSKGYNLVLASNLGFLAPAGTPHGIVVKFWNAVTIALHSEAWKSYEATSHVVIDVLGPSALATYMLNSLAKYKRLVG